MTAKLSKRKLWAAAAAAVAVIVVLVYCCGRSAPGEPDEGHLRFLSSFGYTVKGEPIEVQKLRIPDEPSELFERYNELQRAQGYDLSQYAGQTVTRYVYAIEDYDDSGTQWNATLLVSHGQIIGGDVASTEPGGVMHGFERCG